MVLYETWRCIRSFFHAHVQSFLDRFVFFWGCEQCSKMFSKISPGFHYYLKDLKCVYYACHGKDYGKEDQTLLINNEPNKVFQNSKWIGLYFESFKGQMLSKNKVQWLDLPFHLWPHLVGLHWPKQFKFIMTFKPCLSSLSKSYSWFL